MKKRVLLFLCFFSILAISCQNVGAVKVTGAIDYTLWEEVLSTYVNDHGLVNYEALVANRDGLDQFIQIVEQVDVSKLTDLEAKTFWINAYNALTLKVIIDKYPVKSIRKINFGLVWEIPRFAAGKKVSLGHIEHKILRPLGDPRIHFAINCASIGCPKLPNTVFYPEQLDRRLTEETRNFVNDPQKVKLDRKANILYYSAIMDWFEEDFLVEEDNVKMYIKKYINQSDQAYLDKNEVTLKVLKYDWGLNKQRK